MTNTLDELIKRGGQIVLSEADALCAEFGWSRQEFCDAFSRRVAHQYNDNVLPFESADIAMNWLYEFAFHQMGAPIPEYFLDVYLAFDRGEFASSEDAPETDPEQAYTRPLISEIVAKDRAAARA
ncbi:hypothetical protein [Cognatiluteimonas telluris]|uniref:hypothetical protein n=1 Tax=Cognatiluteimonas telluris TaxID=1104775 RepID=UPI001407EC7D|nr:hypothetical protein [Lysobacter telluris]